MSEKWGDIARARIQARGLIYFDDVLRNVGTIQESGIRAVIALAAAHCLASEQIERGSTNVVDRACVEAIDSMWDLLMSGHRHIDSSAIGWLENLRQHSESEEVDRDVVAATFYAAQAVVDGDTEAAVWAVSRLIDHRFEQSGSTVDDFVNDCATPKVQAILEKLRSTIEILSTRGLSPEAVEAVRNAYGG